MIRLAFILLFNFFVSSIKSQELFVLTMPASNIPAKSMVFRNMNSVFWHHNLNDLTFHTMPEIQYGISKKTMLVANSFISNNLKPEGGSMFLQYRLLSIDATQSHFRLALFGKFSLNNAKIHQEEIELNGHNSGYKAGITATKLIHKTAISSSISYTKAISNINNPLFTYKQVNAIDFTVSSGHLFYPKKYKSYKQTNINGMVEMLSQWQLNNKKYLLDIAPIIQFVFLSKIRTEIGCRLQLKSNLLRTAPNGVFVNFQYIIFNVVK